MVSAALRRGADAGDLASVHAHDDPATRQHRAATFDIERILEHIGFDIIRANPAVKEKVFDGSQVAYFGNLIYIKLNVTDLIELIKYHSTLQ